MTYTVTSNSADGYSHYYGVEAESELAACEKIAQQRGVRLTGHYIWGGPSGQDCIRETAGGDTLTLVADKDYAGE